MHLFVDIYAGGNLVGSTQITGLSVGVSIKNVGLLVLKIPWDNDEQVLLPYPHPLFNLPRNAAEPRFSVLAHNPYLSCAKELVGYGTSADAYHLTAGPEDGSGARRAMEQALRQAAVSPADVQHINAHATSTQVGDKGELAAIRSVFGSGASVAISSTKSATGHLLGAAGGIEAVFTVLALRDQVVPPTLNLNHPDEAADGLDLVALNSRQLPITHALSNGFGFGGVNASVLFRRWAPEAE